jgi:hypothetical protein
MRDANAQQALRQMLATNAGIALLKELTDRRAEERVTFDAIARANAVQGTRTAEQSVTFGRLSAFEELVTTLEEIRDGETS